MLVDDSGAGIQHMREGVAGFLRIVQRTAEVAIVSTAGQNTVVVDFTVRSRRAASTASTALLTRTTTGGYLLDAIRKSARTLMRREATRPVIVVLALEGKEFSNLSAAACPRGPAAQRGGGPRRQRRQAVDEDDDLVEPAADRLHPRSARRDDDAERRPGGGAAAIGRPPGTARPGDAASRSGLPGSPTSCAISWWSPMRRPQSAKPAERIEVSVKRRGSRCGRQTGSDRAVRVCAAAGVRGTEAPDLKRRTESTKTTESRCATRRTRRCRRSRP